MSTDPALRSAADVRRDLALLPRANTPSVRVLRRKYSKELAAESPASVHRFVRSLVANAGWPERLIAYEVLAAHRGACDAMNARLLAELSRGLADWGTVDMFGVTLLGQAWREGIVSDAAILAMTRSPDRWRRRLALVATVPLNSRSRGGAGDARRTLRICRAIVDDDDDMVVKAMSWALRELAKRDPRAVRAFLAEEDRRLAARVKREVGNKLRTGRKSGRSPVA